MKKLIIAANLLLLANCIWAQTPSDPQVITTSTSVIGKTTSDNAAIIDIHVGSPIIYGYLEISNTIVSVHFPYGVLYIEGTFDETLFEVSKGYFGDKILINWTIAQNAEDITQIKVYRRLFDDSNTDDFTNYTQIATLQRDAFQFEDANVQGGTLYEYKIEAVGVLVIPAKFLTYITGVGYRNPTGVITGNVSFDGGSPVKDVVVRADPQGGTSTFGSSLLFDGNQSIHVPMLRNKELANSDISLQAWLRADDPAPFQLFTLSEFDNTPLLVKDLEVIATITNTYLEVSTQFGVTDRTMRLEDFYPTGTVDGRGFDVLKPIAELTSEFFHLSIVLKEGEAPVYYLNGRLMDSDYNNTLDPELTNMEKPVIAESGTLLFSSSSFGVNDVDIGNQLIGHVDEVRIWNKALTDVQIWTDFKRYLGGGESNLVSYLRCDENAGDFAYDISKVGFEFNKNHGEIISVDKRWSDVKPTTSQLGILGVTDSNGNYIISAIPYAGTGESYNITPLFGVHEFEPSQQLVFLGAGSEIINKIDFRDISSFDFLGVVYYTTIGVFDPIGPLAGIVTSVLEDGYNQYRAIIDGNEQLISKGSNYYDGSVLFETPRVFLAEANVYVDGEIVLDKDKRPVLTDPEGLFKIKVPIGNHYIEVKKDKHGFTHSGRFPAAREDGDDLFEFFEHQQSAVTFLDTTRVSLVGRVVGGTIESAKPIGFGSSGSLKEIYNPGTPEEQTLDISSINNIGQATITLSYLPFGGTPGIGELEHTFTTNEETGEYKVSLLPLSYTIDQTNGLRIASDPGIQILQANETVNLTAAQDPISSEYQDPVGATVFSDPYHFVKSFTHRSTPVLNVISQSFDIEVFVIVDDVNGNSQQMSVSTEGFQYPVYTQGVSYAIVFETFEEYINKDGGAGNEVIDQVPIVDGEFNITNNLALVNSESLTVDKDIPSISTYIFKAGLPSISTPFTRTIDIKYRVDGKDYDARNYETEGIILGGQSDGSQTFVTQAPDVPDIILRDPPGTNSSATIESGKSISFTEEADFNIGQNAETKVEMKLGIKFEAGGGLAGPVITAEAVNSIKAGISLSVESSNGKSISKTYTFNQTISTSDDPTFVGSDADLYIGNTKNYFYGSYDNVRVSSVQLGTDPSLLLTNDIGESIHVSKQKAFYFSEEPTNTFFIYSQKHILKTLIPELQGIIEGIEIGTILESTPGVLKKSQYEEQIRLWRKVIQDNERTKYLALFDRENYKDKIKSNLEAEIEAINDHLIAIAAIGGTLVGVGVFGSAINIIPVGIQSLADAIDFLNEKKGLLQTKLDFLEEEFLRNISFDAGVGEFTNSSEITIAQTKTRKIKFDIDASLETTFGFHLNKTGLLLHTSNTLNTSMTSALTQNESESTTVSYTLKDNDKYNFLSVDVVNTFDGNGPVFSTIGGRTSCPYEGIDLTEFYKHSEYSYETDTAGVIYSGGDQISYATQKVEVPAISVEVASVTDVPETRAAEFKLILENNSVAEADAFFELYVDNTTNPKNAKINIAANGNIVFVPYGKKIEFALTLEKSISDVYEYKDINIVLGSICDPFKIFDVVTISAVFRPSCTAVELDNPLGNWVFNAGDAYNSDNTTNPLNIAMFGYDRSFSSFENYRLEYRKATSSSWTKLRNYYNTQELLDDAIIQGEDQGTFITDNTTFFPWDIGALGLSDGQYELRAVSNCNNGTIFVSDVVRGTVDLNAPVQFGTPSPTDGILGAGEDLRLQFSEDILYSSALSKIEIKGETNQQDINHNVSLHFEGVDNTLVLEKPSLTDGDFSIEFWMLNQTSGIGTIMSQADGLSLIIGSGSLQWTFGGKVLTVDYATDDLFHHYTLTYNDAFDRMSIYFDDLELGSIENVTDLNIQNQNPIVIGGNTFVGNIHDLRFWSKWLSLAESNANKSKELLGSERDLVGYWPINEGVGTIANDLARFRNGLVNADWDIKPKGSSYSFQGNAYLELDDVGFVQLTDEMDVTLSFWLKTNDLQNATLFSNGRGNGDDQIQSNGRANKWAISLENGLLFLQSEGIRFMLSTSNLADDKWHHVAVILRRLGSLKTYVDAELESSNPVTDIGGISGNKFWIGARGYVNTANEETTDEFFSGKLDEIRLWNMARSFEQVNRDRFNEVAFNDIGLMLYARFNTPDPPSENGPAYYHLAANETVLPSNAVLRGGTISYSDDAPKIKLQREYLNFQVTHVINGDEMIITPLVSDWSVLEGQIIDITVDRMFDVYGNRQSSPVTWSAFVRRNEVSWFAEDGSQQLDIEKQSDDILSFELTILNKGGKQQPFTIENVPSWLSASELSGTLAPNSDRTIVFEIDPDLNTGNYSLDLYLATDFNFDEKMLINLRVLENAPEWEVDPADFEFSMNMIAILDIGGVISSDELDRVAAFVGDEVRGMVQLEYIEAYDLHFAFFSIYSNLPSGENIDLKVWDASTGIVYPDVTPEMSFVSNDIIGSFSNPVIIQTNLTIEQEIPLVEGWNWVSFAVDNPDDIGIPELFEGIQLTDGDYIKYIDAFAQYSSDFGWSGNLTEVISTNAYKIRVGSPMLLRLQGKALDINNLIFNLAVGWNWLSYPNQQKSPVNVALGLFDAAPNDVIKDQVSFAIYDDRLGWVGSLTHLKPGNGYMLRSENGGSLKYQHYSAGANQLEIQEHEVLHNSNSEKTISVIVSMEDDDYLEGDILIAISGNEEVGQVLWTKLGDGRKSYFISIDDISKRITYILKRNGTKYPLKVSKLPDALSNTLTGSLDDPLILKMVGIDNSNRLVQVSPNPSDGTFNLKIKKDDASDIIIQLMDIQGKIIWKERRSVSGLYEEEVDIVVAPGLYILRVIFHDNISESNLIIIK